MPRFIAVFTAILFSLAIAMTIGTSLCHASNWQDYVLDLSKTQELKAQEKYRADMSSASITFRDAKLQLYYAFDHNGPVKAIAPQIDAVINADYALGRLTSDAGELSYLNTLASDLQLFKDGLK